MYYRETTLVEHNEILDVTLKYPVLASASATMHGPSTPARTVCITHSTAFANYFTINSAVYLYYNTRVRENLHLDSVTTNYGKRTAKYKASKMWNQLPSSLKEFFSVENFSNKFNKFLQVVDIDNTV